MNNCTEKEDLLPFLCNYSYILIAFPNSAKQTNQLFPLWAGKTDCHSIGRTTPRDQQTDAYW